MINTRCLSEGTKWTIISEVNITKLHTGHHGLCCNPCNWDGRYWMPMMVGNTQGPMLDKFGICTSFLNMEPQGIRP